MSDKGKLQFNPGPLKVVPDAQREAWTRNTYKWRCEHTDGRGQCSSRETRTFWNSEQRRAEAYCEKHHPRPPGGSSDG